MKKILEKIKFWWCSILNFFRKNKNSDIALEPEVSFGEKYVDIEERIKDLKNEKTVVEQKFYTQLGEYFADGELREFKITDGKRFDFLVKNGVIVAVKDTKKSNEFIYYKETK